MPREIKHESEIRAVLDHQLTNLRTYTQDPRVPSQDMAGLRSTYGYDKGTADHTDELLKTGQVPMDVNAMPGLMLDESEDKSGGVNAMQNGDACFFCKKSGHLKRDCKKYLEWKKNSTSRKAGSTQRSQFPVITVGRKVISQGNVRKRGRIPEREITEIPETGRWPRWFRQLYRKC